MSDENKDISEHQENEVQPNNEQQENEIQPTLEQQETNDDVIPTQNALPQDPVPEPEPDEGENVGDSPYSSNSPSIAASLDQVDSQHVFQRQVPMINIARLFDSNETHQQQQQPSNESESIEAVELLSPRVSVELPNERESVVRLAGETQSVVTLFKIDSHFDLTKSMTSIHPLSFNPKRQSEYPQSRLARNRSVGEDEHPTGESPWDKKLRDLTESANLDSRFEPTSVSIYSKLSTSSSDPIESVSSVINLPLRPDTRKNFNSRQSYSSTIAARPTLSKLYTVPNYPFSYGIRPFRMPEFSTSEQAITTDQPLRRTRSHESGIPIGFDDWANITGGSDTYIAVRQWRFPEPTAANLRLPPEVDPLVQFQVENAGGDVNQMRLKDLQNIQKEIELYQSPSGRKLDDFGNVYKDEQGVFTRVKCRDDPDFDLLHHFDLGDEGKWPNPYYFYWNWKRLDGGDVDEHYKRDINKINDRKFKIAKELASNRFKIPYYRIGDNDTDVSDPENSRKPQVTKPDNAFSLRWKLNEVREDVTDPMEERYPYLYLHLQGKVYNKYYALQKNLQKRYRLWYKLWIKFRTKQGVLTFRCHKQNWTSYPYWYICWKHMIKHIIRRCVPRKYKFLDEKYSQTIFYGTLASLYGTQYIAEHDALSTMDNPVLTSQIALQKALEIKQKFLIMKKNGQYQVDYLKLQRSKDYELYLQWIGMMCRYQPIKMTHRVRKVFFLNYFNVLSIQTQIWRIPEVENMKYLWEMKDFWEKTKGLAGFMEFSLEEIYHGILRCNKPHPIKQAPVFKESIKGLPREMVRTRLSLDWLDPRIHFALNIGCKSCPPIQVFSLYEHEYQLDEVAKRYIRERVKIDMNLRLVTVPILFLWYEKDFGNNQRVLLWYIKRYMLAKNMLKIRKLVTSKRTIVFQYEPFDYTLDHVVRRVPVLPNVLDSVRSHNIIPLYWGSRF